MPTIRQIADVCGVSPMTVSHVLNNTPGQVGEETRARVLQTVREMGYRPRTAASRRQAKVRTLGIALGRDFLSFTGNGYHSTILQGILNATQQAGLNILLYHSSLFHTDTHHAVRTHLDGQCDGLIVVSPFRDNPLMPMLQERGTPFVAVGEQTEAPQVSFVDVDNVQGARLVTAHLIELGHRHIAYIGGPDFVLANHQRREGYRAALADAGIACDPRLDLGNLVGDAAVYQAIIERMRQVGSPRPTAFFVWNDGAALRALIALQDLGLSVPRDVSVAGFDDLTPATIIPALTTIRQPYNDIGNHAVDALIALTHDPKPHRIALAGRLIVRDSTAPPPVALSRLRQ